MTRTGEYGGADNDPKRNLETNTNEDLGRSGPVTTYSRLRLTTFQGWQLPRGEGARSDSPRCICPVANGNIGMIGVSVGR